MTDVVPVKPKYPEACNIYKTRKNENETIIASKKIAAKKCRDTGLHRRTLVDSVQGLRNNTVVVVLAKVFGEANGSRDARVKTKSICIGYVLVNECAAKEAGGWVDRYVDERLKSANKSFDFFPTGSLLLKKAPKAFRND
ncbi:hypothetical protein AG1IA_08440 [Rhizoctonia solani AG-1 IA]|uniref:Uncharacterized protein n=1 Tax=Thanatephorus cucumeris (strain AG1-IA) TaxID=983506 RepID=L8WHV4_THACA|nr:hypothetical protein AG1IA_08440 [Rhizoctonia solani AG-1 IA]